MTVSSAPQEKYTDKPGVAPGFLIREVKLDQDLSSMMTAWKRCAEKFQEDCTIVSDPEWLQARVRIEKANITSHLIEANNEVVGAVSFESYSQHLRFNLGDFTLARAPIRVRRLLGYTPSLPPETEAHDLVFERILDSDFDAIYMASIRGDSFFWNYIHTSRLIRRNFTFYSQRGLRPHPVIRISGAFDEYMKKFSSKTRSNLSRKLKKLREAGAVQLVKVTEPQHVDSFVEAAVQISRKTYQFRLLGFGTRNPDLLREWLKWAAGRGWLRSYLLTCGGIPIAFQIAYQYSGIFLGIDIGFDPEWGQFGVGITQQLLALEDVFKENPPRLYETGGYADYKQMLANDSYSRANLWLFRRKLYPDAVLNAYRLCNFASAVAGDTLHRFNLKTKIRGFLRKGH